VAVSCVAPLLVLTLFACNRGNDETAGTATRSGSGTMDSTAIARADSQMRGIIADSGQWPLYGRGYDNTRYSTLTQVTSGNVSGLTLAWKYNTGIKHAFEATPVVVNGTMYVSTPINHIIALDARTGQKKWEYAQELGTTVHCCGPVNRGVAYYDGKVFMGTLDGKLVAVDASTGQRAWEVTVADDDRYAIDGAPTAVDGKVITGVSGGEYGIRGFVDAYDANTGQRIWRFYSIPSPEDGGWWGNWSETDAFGTSVHRNVQREKQDSAQYADAWKVGGGGVWQHPAVDLQRRLVIFNVGNPSPDLDGSVRPGDNLYTNSLVAIDLDTGKHRWHFQTIPHDVWDLDAASPVVLLDVRDSSGATRPAVAHAGKTGWVYIVDRETGRPIRRSDAFVPQANMFAQPTREGTRMLPGANGGSEWSPTAYDPQTGYLYVLGLHQPMLYKVASEELKPPAFWLGGAFVGTGEPQYGLFSAVDVNTGKIAWQKRMEKPLIGGALATAGGVVFMGNPSKEFLAFDAKSGNQLWRYQATGGVNGPPMTYMIDGTQYVAVVAGGVYQINAPRSDEVLVFSLNGGSQGANTGDAGAGAGDTTRRDTGRTAGTGQGGR
jgi:PQQ-dependent dehydrogenase (methanol/ethanol family)